ncbi:MAG TPA: methylmalonyl-CoA carboxyltransferase, partial [Terrabacter sp.]|nr:methylmalonyl-CoA carboxyltransferase [Terrabacter sp.]
MATDHAVAEQPPIAPAPSTPDTDGAPGLDLSTTAGKLADLKRRVAEVANAGSERAVEKQHARGKKTARER